MTHYSRFVRDFVGAFTEKTKNRTISGGRREKVKEVVYSCKSKSLGQLHSYFKDAFAEIDKNKGLNQIVERLHLEGKALQKV